MLLSVDVSCSCLGHHRTWYDWVSSLLYAILFNQSACCATHLTMLRLGSSRIYLEKEDLEYHKKTHQRRQKARGQGHLAEISTSAQERAHKRNQSSKSSATPSPKRYASASPITRLVPEQSKQDFLISEDPVPRGSRAFWDKVLAEAGTPTRTKSTGSGNGRIFDPSDEWIETNRSARASVEESIGLDSDTKRGSSSGDDLDLLASRARDFSESGFLQSNHPAGRSGGDGSIDAALVSTQQPSARNRFSSLFRWRTKSAINTDGMQANDPVDLGLDGLDGHSSDLSRSHDRERSDSAEFLRGRALGDGLYGGRRDRHEISSKVDKATMIDEIGHRNDLSNGNPSERLSPSLVSLPMLSGPRRRPSGPLSQSPLHISQAVASSSLNKNQSVPYLESDRPMANTPGLLFSPPKRRRTYRSRSETYSFERSETSSCAAQIPLEAPSRRNSNTERGISLLSSPLLASISNGSPLSLDSITHPRHHQSSTSLLIPSLCMTPLPPSISGFSSSASSRIETPRNPFNRTHTGRTSPSPSHMLHLPLAPRSSSRALAEVEGYRSASSASSAASPNHNMRPYARSFEASNRRARNLTPQYPLPPPFGATSRTVSYSRTMPTSMSPNPNFSALPISPKTTPPHQRSAIARTPITPSRSTFSIYNDSQPPHSQPQTAADLTRRLVVNPFNTAPTHRRPSFLPPTAANRASPTLPRRRRQMPVRPQQDESLVGPEPMVSPGAENADTVSIEERESRRVWNLRVRLGGEEQRRLQISPGLDHGSGI